MYRFRAALWRWQGDAAWHFVTVPIEISDEIEERTAAVRRGFGSVRVHASIGATSWDTSLFPDSKAEAYVLPVKEAVRRAVGVEAGDTVTVALELAELGEPA